MSRLVRPPAAIDYPSSDTYLLPSKILHTV